MSSDTIAAISTPPGSGGIAVIRLSGPEAVNIADSVILCKPGVKQAISHRVYVAKVLHDNSGATSPGDFIDEVLVTVFRGPKSYTGEDVVEISCHGGVYISHRVLQILLSCGARLARPGEFTERAFLNGRLDLAQAESVADMIAAKTALSQRAAMNQFQGGLSRVVKQLRTDLVDLCSLLELELDFAEEDVEFADRAETAERLARVEKSIERLLSTYERGRILREGIKLAIVGKPNVGKSSLLNALVKEERAIVTDIPGTTRDVLEEQLDIRGLLFTVVDTAGIRKTADPIEKEGVRRSRQQIEAADIILFVVEGNAWPGVEDRALAQEIQSQKYGSRERHVVLTANKIDLGCRITPEALDGLELGPVPQVFVSAKTHEGLSDLEEALVDCALGREPLDFNEPLLANIRQKEALDDALSCICIARKHLGEGLSVEFVAQDLREALSCLGEIVGEVTSEHLLENIFSKFCIGK